ncbi:MAG: hypothetical protein IKN38_06520 [Clostridia bacterium]|nr:hypothetical protein [Clostridia bacterium]
MKTIKIDLSAVMSDPLGEKDKKPGFFKKMKILLASRSFNGPYSVEIKNAAFLRKKVKGAESGIYHGYSIAKYFLGSSLAKKLYPDSDEAIAALYDKAKDGKVEYRRCSRLYHFTTVECLGSIIRSGLRAGREGKVFLSDTIDLKGFLRWKTLAENKDSEFCVLKIDARRLAKKHKLRYYRKNEIVTDHVEPEYIEVI